MTKPYLKWAGSKTQLAAKLIPKFPDSFNRYMEPFCGSAAMFLIHLDRYGDVFDSDMPEVYLNDSNSYLINCHNQIAKYPEDVMEILKCFEIMYEDNPKSFYHKIRRLVIEDDNEVTMAARFIFINKTCFNGLWRVNSKGKFNTPWNQTTSVNTFVRGNIRACSRMFKKAKLSVGHFRDIIKESISGDFLFVDPPYEPISASSSFTSYTKSGWNMNDTHELAEVLSDASDRGVKFMMTNSISPVIYDYFGKFNIDHIEAHRFVKAVSSYETREKVKETIVTNY